MFEIIHADKMYSGAVSRSPAGLLCDIFEHTLSQAAGQPDKKQLYGIVRKFRRYEGQDHYRYSDLSVFSFFGSKDKS